MTALHSLLVAAGMMLAAGLAPAQDVTDIDIWRTAGPLAPAPVSPTKIIDSDGRDASPHVSRDGAKVVFSSTRSGTWEVWTCDSDGANVFQATYLLDTPVGSTRWSPDGKKIAFDGQKPGHYDLYVMNGDGTGLQQLTIETSTDVKPSWSKDGRWIYYTSDRNGAYQVWKISPEGGEPVQVTQNGGYTPFESPDGKFIYYSKGRNENTLWRIPVSGGEETLVLENVVHNRWVILNAGICILNMDAKPRPVIEFFDFTTGNRRSIDVLPQEGAVYGGGTAIAAPPDGRWLLFGRIE